MLQDKHNDLVKKLMLTKRIEMGIRERLLRMVYQLTVLYAPKGSGKTSTLVFFTLWAKRLFNARIVTIGSAVSYRPAFGKVYEITLAQFLEQLAKIDKLIEEKEIVAKYNSFIDPWDMIQYLEPICMERGIIIFNSWIITDEMRKLLGRRTSLSKTNRQLDTFAMQMRHYFITIVGTIPNWQQLDNYALDQLDWRVDCSMEYATQDITLHYRGQLSQNRRPWTWIFNGLKYRRYFNSYGLLGFGSSILGKPPKIKEEGLESLHV